MKDLKPAREVFILEMQGPGAEVLRALQAVGDGADPGQPLKGWRRVDKGRKCLDGKTGGPGDYGVWQAGRGRAGATAGAGSLAGWRHQQLREVRILS